MKKRSLVSFIMPGLMLATSLVVFAQGSRSSWSFFAAVSPQKGAGKYDLVLPLEVIDKSRPDLADLRLYDTTGREIPYALRVRREINDRREVAVNVFNLATIGSASEASVDLGENPSEHNEIEIETTGQNFRRKVDVEGSETGHEWRTLKAGAVIFSFEAQNRIAASTRVSYPTSRFRFLRVRVFADTTDEEVPVITGVKVMMVGRQAGELITWDTLTPSYQLLRNQGAPSSSWTVDLGGNVPLDRLTLDVADPSFSRSFQLDEISDPQNIRLLASGELTRRVGEVDKPLVIRFDNEEYAKKLRLLINDYSNQALTVSAIKASAPARVLVFDLKETDGRPLRLFFGNPNATPPHYDFEKELPVTLTAAPTRSTVGGVTSNPDYKPEPLPLTERLPWLIYLVLAASSIALALILLSLARTTMRTKPLERQGPGTTASG